ncbi:CaiB/BaiF CoA transferase family protein, partial [Actinophytocola sp.]|uniref:CaiB/BaiF CoA transferase family protein n=1 Tax=Actinophytocola sp. TaxID=1872138 RepID=UPI00389B04BC
RRWIGVDTKSAAGRDIVLRLVDRADVLVEGYRPGVTERLGLGPDDCLSRNPRLVYGRITGWGQDGPMAQTAGHDINYIGLSGALEPIGRAGERPVPPLNLLGDFGGGGMLLAMGVLAALVERSVSGRGQVVDASMVEGSALLTAGMHGLLNLGMWGRGRGANMLDGGAPFYDTYETSDGRYVAVGAIEERFWHALLGVLEIDPATVAGRLDPEQWPAVRSVLDSVIRTRTRDEWAKRAEGTDACLTPVLTPAEAAGHPHNVARGSFVTLDGDTQPAPAPRFSRTAPDTPTAPVEPRSSTGEVLADLGFSPSDIDGLRADGVVA